MVRRREKEVLLIEIHNRVKNNLKYAFPHHWEQEGRIDVELLNAEEGQLTLVVCDDGVGVEPDMDLRRTQSLGLQLVNRLTDQITGTIEVDRSAGTTFRVTFPHTERQP